MQEADISLVGPLNILLQSNPIHVVLKRLQALIKGINGSKMHRIAVPLYELGIQDFSRLADEAGRSMSDANALARMPSLCSRVTARHERALNRLTLLLNGHDWMDHAAAHAFQRTTALPRKLREVFLWLSLART